jgi:malonyl-CoA decarboxylase
LKLAQLLGLPSRQERPSERENGRAVASLLSACRRLLSERGEISATRLATEILASYQALDTRARELFFGHLAKEFSPNPERVCQEANAYRQDPSPENLARLQRAVEAPRQELFRRLNVAPGGTRLLVEMRGHLLGDPGPDSARAPIAADLKHLLTAWFNRGFLVLQRIDWRTSATILEKLIRYEAVHQIQGFDDLRRRLLEDRRCYAFFHPALPEEPIIFVEAALTQGMSDKVQPLLDPESPVVDPESADCAIFYSITNCQDGLRGVPLGSFLIKQVVEDLGRAFPRIRRFATLSPVPGFREWLRKDGLSLASVRTLAKLDDPECFKDRKVSAELEQTLIPLCAYYLLRAKRSNEPVDSVARFHLRNGARLERVNWLGDTSKAGMERSAGFTVNYRYRLSDLERNHELYTRDYRVAASRDIEGLAKHAVAWTAGRNGNPHPQSVRK